MEKYYNWLASQATLLRQQGLAARVKAFSRKISKSTVKFICVFLSSHHRLRRSLIPITKTFGIYNATQALYMRILAHTHTTSRQPTNITSTRYTSLNSLTPHELSIYLDLKEHIRSQQKLEN